MVPDLTILYITASEMPKHWVEFQIRQLLTVVGDTPIISVSREPMSLGENLVEQEPRSYWNIYRQMLRAARLARTKYVAMVEDDTLYSYEHFTEYRPPGDAVSYNRSRWSLFVWDVVYCLRQRISNCTLIAPREYLIDALEERELVWPEGAPNKITGEVGRPIVDRKLHVKPRNMVEWYSSVPVVQLNHPQSTADGGQQRQDKRHGQLKADMIPYWGEAQKIVDTYYECTPSNT